MCLDALITPPKFNSRFRKNRFIRICYLQGRLVRGGPDVAARDIADVTERPPVVARTVFMPPRHPDVLPSTVTTTCVCHHHVIGAIRKQLHLRSPRAVCFVDPHWTRFDSGSG